MEFLQHHKKAAFLLVLIVLVVVMAFTVNYKEPTLVGNALGFIIAPAQEAVTAVERYLESQVKAFSGGVTALEAENKSLREQIDILNFELNRMDMLEKDVESLRALLELDLKYPDFQKVGAEKIARDANNWSKSFNIDKGTKDGIEENMVVLAGGGLGGRVSKVSMYYSQVVPIIDDASSVGAQSKRSGDYGFVKGDLKLSELNLCKMENISLDADILVNDEIITSNLGGIYPPGILIGYVQEIHVDSSGLNKYAIIKPVADFKHLEGVLIITESFGTEERAEPNQ